MAGAAVQPPDGTASVRFTFADPPFELEGARSVALPAATDR